MANQSTNQSTSQPSGAANSHTTLRCYPANSLNRYVQYKNKSLIRRKVLWYFWKIFFSCNMFPFSLTHLFCLSVSRFLVVFSLWGSSISSLYFLWGDFWISEHNIHIYTFAHNWGEYILALCCIPSVWHEQNILLNSRNDDDDSI